jgi:hypothetical protein
MLLPRAAVQVSLVPIHLQVRFVKHTHAHTHTHTHTYTYKPAAE